MSFDRFLAEKIREDSAALQMLVYVRVRLLAWREDGMYVDFRSAAGSALADLDRMAEEYFENRKEKETNGNG